MKRTLSDTQKKAVSHFENPMIVLAGPGSGKTTVICHRVAYLINTHNVNPENILVVTFTKNAASEMEERFKRLVGDPYTDVTFSTFHAFYFRVIRQHLKYNASNILSEDFKRNALKGIVRELELEINDIDEFIRDFLIELSILKADLTPLKKYKTTLVEKTSFQLVLKQYELYKDIHQKIDFDDMISLCLEILQNEPDVLKKWQDKYKYILIDEFQDINYAQYECIKLIAKPSNNIFVVGDDDQSIYSFRGARPEILLNFNKDFKNATKIILDKNYRSTEKIIKISQKLVSNNKVRYEKEYTGVGDEGSVLEFFTSENTPLESLKIATKIIKLNKSGISFNKIAILFRTNMQASSFTRALSEKGISYHIKDGLLNIYEHWICKDFLAYIHLCLNNESLEDFQRIANKPKRYLNKEIVNSLNGHKGNIFDEILSVNALTKWQCGYIIDLKQHLTLIAKKKPLDAFVYIRDIIGYKDYLEDYAKFKQGSFVSFRDIMNQLCEDLADVENLADIDAHFLNLSEQLKESKEKSNIKNAVTLSTLHSAKGLEYEAVFLPSVIDGLLPFEKSNSSIDIEEERRLFYVGITRAKSFVCISEVKNRFDRSAKRSDFINELFS